MNIEEAKELLQEMRENCIDKGKTYYEDDMRVKKALAIETVLADLDKQEKIINAMAKDIYTTDLHENICTKNNICDCYVNEFAREHLACIECIKQYYEKKVSEE